MARSAFPFDTTRRALLLGGLSLALPARAGRELLAVGAPFARVFERSQGGFSGMAPEILRSIGAQLGQPVQLDMYPWPRAQSMVALGQADILIGPYKTAERFETIAFSERAFYQDEMVFYARNGAVFDWDGSYAALRGKRIVLVNGWAFGEEFDTARKEMYINVTNSVDAALGMLALGRVDLFATNRRNTEPVIASLGLLDKVAPLERIISTQRGYFGFPRRPEHEALRQRFDRAFNQFVEAGELRKLGRRLSVQIP